MTTIPDAGLDRVANIIKNDFTYMATGSGSTAEATTDTTLATENTTNGAERALATVTAPATESTGVTKWVKEFSITGSVTIREIAIFNAASNGDMLLRRVLTSGHTYVSGETVTITVTHTQSRS